MQTFPLREDVKFLNRIINNYNHTRDAIEEIKKSNVYLYTLTKKDKTVFKWFKKLNWRIEDNTLHINDVEIAVYLVRLYDTKYFDIMCDMVTNRKYYCARLISNYLISLKKLEKQSP